MTEKRIDKCVPDWYIFGENKSEGTVDIAQQDGDVFQELPKDIAEKVIEAHDRFKKELYQLLKDVK